MLNQQPLSKPTTIKTSMCVHSKSMSKWLMLETACSNRCRRLRVMMQDKEALPLPVAFVAYLEWYVMQQDSDASLALFAGSCLICIYASLRYNDALSVEWSSLCIDSDTLRGTARRTKTTRSGMPWGIILKGVLGSQGLSNSWVGHYFFRLGKVWDDIQAIHAGFPRAGR